MKLRNKKTGEVFDALIRERGGGGTYSEPVEPLIKDEKIRKAVRAWADANGLDYANCYESAHAWYLRAFNSREQGIDIDIEFWGYQLPKELKDYETYTITELCGEEEE